MNLYWLLTLARLHYVFNIISVVGFLCCIINLMASTSFYISACDKSERESAKKSLKICSLGILASIFILIFASFIPSKADMAIMIGWDAIQSNSVQDVIEILKKKLE